METDDPRRAIVLQLDGSHLQELKSALSTPKPTRFSAENILTYLQSIAIVVAAVWTLHEYMRFTKTNEALTLQSAQLSNQLNALDLNNRARFQELQSKLAIQLANLNLLSGEEELRFNSLGRLKIEDNFRIKRRSYTKPPRYVAQLGLLLTNMSKTDMYISAIHIRRFIGRVRRAKLRTAAITKVNYPGDRGAIKWTDVGIEKYTCTDCSQLASSFDDLADSSVIPGGATGRIRQGESTVFDYDYLVDADDNAYVGFVINIFDGQGDSWIYREVLPVSDAASARPLLKRSQPSLAIADKAGKR